MLNKPRLDVKSIKARAHIIEHLITLPWLRVSEASFILGTSDATVRRLCVQDTLAATRLGARSWRIRPSAINELLATRGGPHRSRGCHETRVT